jgi:hypothetical protein
VRVCPTGWQRRKLLRFVIFFRLLGRLSYRFGRLGFLFQLLGWLSNGFGRLGLRQSGKTLRSSGG